MMYADVVMEKSQEKEKVQIRQKLELIMEQAKKRKKIKRMHYF